MYRSARFNQSFDKFKAVVQKLSLIMISNFIASMTVVVLSNVSLYTDVPDSLEAMLAYILFPLNSCINPLANTILSKMKGKCNIKTADMLRHVECKLRDGLSKLKPRGEAILAVGCPRRWPHLVAQHKSHTPQ